MNHRILFVSIIDRWLMTYESVEKFFLFLLKYFKRFGNYWKVNCSDYLFYQYFCRKIKSGNISSPITISKNLIYFYLMRKLNITIQTLLIIRQGLNLSSSFLLLYSINKLLGYIMEPIKSFWTYAVFRRILNQIY